MGDPLTVGSETLSLSGSQGVTGTETSRTEHLRNGDAIGSTPPLPYPTSTA